MVESKKIGYGRHWIDDSDIEAVVEILRGDWLTTGPLVEKFESVIADQCGARYAVAMNSGTAALHAAYFAAGLGPGDEMITSPLTFVATASTALHLGATVRLADVEPGTGNIDPERVAETVGPATKLLAPVDYAGHPADYEALRSLSDQHGLSIIADAAHSFGASWHGRPVGSLADATTTSFHPVKLITTAEGGAMTTDNDAWRITASEFRNHGIVRSESKLQHHEGDWHYEVQSLGLNYRIPDVLCALGLSQLGKMDSFLARRRQIAGQYNNAFAAIGGLELPFVREDIEHAWHLYVLRVENARHRQALFDHLRATGLGVQLHYPPVHLHPLFRELGFQPGDYPQAEDFSARAISIPMYPMMTDDDVQYVIETIVTAARKML